MHIAFLLITSLIFKKKIFLIFQLFYYIFLNQIEKRRETCLPVPFHRLARSWRTILHTSRANVHKEIVSRQSGIRRTYSGTL
jgi:hypothetical protein